MSGVTMWKSPFKRADTSDSRNLPLSSIAADAWAMYLPSSSSAEYQPTSSVACPSTRLAVRRLDEAVLVDAGVRRQRRDEADVRTFRRLDRADATVVGRVHVANLEARALAGETARSERREPTLVRDLGERVRLVHELRELRAAEVLLDDSRDRLGVDQVVRHERVDFLRHAHALLDGALHPDQADAVLVLHQLADRADATIAEVVDVVDGPTAVLQLDEVTDGLQDVLGREHLRVELGPLIFGDITVELVVELQATDLREVVALRVEEQVVEEGLRRVERRRVAGTKATVDLHDRVFGRLDLLREKGVAQVAADAEPVDEEDLERVDVRFTELVELVRGHNLVALEDDLAGLLVDRRRVPRPCRRARRSCSGGSRRRSAGGRSSPPSAS